MAARRVPASTHRVQRGMEDGVPSACLHVNPDWMDSAYRGVLLIKLKNRDDQMKKWQAIF